MKINKKDSRLPREVVVASIDLRGIWPAETIEERISDILYRMRNVYVFEPDLICLPETFQTSWVREKTRTEDIAEDENIPGPVTRIIAEEAKSQNCYIVCPLVTKSNGNYYNSAILASEEGSLIQRYDKLHLVPFGEYIPFRNILTFITYDY